MILRGQPRSACGKSNVVEGVRKRCGNMQHSAGGGREAPPAKCCMTLIFPPFVFAVDDCVFLRFAYRFFTSSLPLLIFLKYDASKGKQEVKEGCERAAENKQKRRSALPGRTRGRTRRRGHSRRRRPGRRRQPIKRSRGLR